MLEALAAPGSADFLSRPSPSIGILYQTQGPGYQDDDQKLGVVHECVYIHTRMCMCVHTCVSLLVCVPLCVHTCVCDCLCVCVCAPMHVCTYECVPTCL